MSRSELIQKLLELLQPLAPPLFAIGGSLLVGYFLKRALKKALDTKYGPSARPAWLLSASFLLLVALITFSIGWIGEGLWLDPFVGNVLLRKLWPKAPVFRDLVFPAAAFWLSGVAIVLTFLHTLVTFSIAYLIGPSRTTAGPRPEKEKERKKRVASGMPPASRSRRAYEPEAGLMVALDVAAGLGFVERLFQHVGFFGELSQGVEPRFRLWAKPAARALAWVKWLSLPAAVNGVTSAILWTIAALLLDSWKTLLLPPEIKEEKPERKAGEEKGKDEDGGEEQGPRSRASLLDLLADQAGRPLVALGESRAAPARYGEGPWPAELDGPLWKGAIRAGRSEDFQLYLHQHEAVRSLFRGEDVLLDTLPGSGRGTAAALAAAHVVLCRGGSVLAIVDGARDAATFTGAIRRLGRAGGWHWATHTHDLSNDGLSDLDPTLRQPHVLVGEVDALEKHLMASCGHWDYLWASLALVVIPDIDAHHGARAPALASLIDRLEHLARLASSRPRLFATSNGLWRDTTRLAEALVNRSLTVVGEASDGAPMAAQTGYLAVADQAAAPELARVIRAAGWACAGEDTEPPASSEPASVAHLAALLPAASASLPFLAEETVHLPPSAALVIRALAPDHPLAASLFGAGGARSLVPWLQNAPSLADGCSNPSAGARALRSALMEHEATRAELYSTYGREATDRELALYDEKGMLSVRNGAIIDEVDGLPRETRFYRLAAPAIKPDRAASAVPECAAHPAHITTKVVTDTPLALLDASTKQRIDETDRVRAAVVFYPGRILTRDGSRYCVIEKEGELFAEREPAAIWTLPLRKARVDVSGWQTSELRFANGAPFANGCGDVAIEIEVSATRRFSHLGDLLDERAITPPRAASYQARANVVRFASTEEEPVTLGAVHALTHLVRAAMPIVLRHEAMDLDVVVLPPDERGEPGLAVVDLHPFGAGFADALKAEHWRRLFQLSLELCRAVPRAADATFCTSPRDSLEPPSLDGAKRLLERLLG